MEKNDLLDKIKEFSTYSTLKEVEDMYIILSMSMLEDKQKSILYNALDIQKEYLEGKFEDSAIVVISELKTGEL